MSRSGGRNARRRGLCRAPLAALALVTLVTISGVGGGAGPAFAEAISSPQVTGIELTVPVQRALQQLQEQWLQWISATNAERSGEVVDDLLATSRQLGMSRLPDLSLGALVQAVTAAQDNDFRRAEWALAAAERLDPGRPETSFARSRVAWLAGRPFAALGNLIDGYRRALGLPLERSLLFQALVFWLLCLLLATGGLFVAVQMATKGGALLHDVAGALGRKLPPTGARAAAVVALVWPLALPYGLAWLILYWSLLLWGYGSKSERAVAIALWLILGITPFVIAEQQRRIATTLSPPVHAMVSLDQGRLYGGLFTDLGVLRSRLPESPAVKHLLADVHRTFGQWELARGLYRQVLEKEPENAAALLNLGVYFFYKGDFGNAIPLFRKAAAADPTSAAAYFNLSQAYSESYLFEDMGAAQRQARQIDPERVEAWLGRDEKQRIVVMAGGLARTQEIRRELLANRSSLASLDLVRRSLTAILAVGLVLLALALHVARRRSGYAAVPADWRLGYGRAAGWRRVLLPGVASLEGGEGLRAFLALLIPAGLFLIPVGERLGYRVPWGYDPGTLLPWTVAITGLVLFLGARLYWERRNEV
jgi:tetratricopeptide (TPR) repeat protein